MATRLKPRQRLILEALLNLGKKATTTQIAEKTKLHVNGVTQSLGALTEFVKMGKPAKGGEQKWRLIKEPPPLTQSLWNQLNKRRIELIYKRSKTRLTGSEHAEYIDLQETADRYVEAICPLKPVLRVLKRMQSLDYKT